MSSNTQRIIFNLHIGRINLKTFCITSHFTLDFLNEIHLVFYISKNPDGILQRYVSFPLGNQADIFVRVVLVQTILYYIEDLT